MFRLLVLALALAAPAQQALRPSDDRSGQATFKSGVDLVRFDVRIVDENGRPITDLRQDEIVVEENGKALPLVLFQRVTEPAESYVEAALRAVSAQVSSNEAFPRGHLYILLFDQQHIMPGNEARARMAAEQFIRRRVRPSDRVAVYAVPGPGPEVSFTADRVRAIQALDTVRGMAQKTVDSAFGRMTVYEAHRVVQGDVKLMGDLLVRMAAESGTDVVTAGGDAAGARRAAVGEDIRASRLALVENARQIVNQTDAMSRQFLQRLADVVTQFRDIEGRKTVVLFSEGFFQDNLARELETVAAAAAQSYSVFYTFDLNQRGPSLTEASAPETTQATEIQDRIAPLATLAVETDGMMVVDAGARTQEALDRIADQAQDYYLLGFAPSQAARTARGKYQRVNVKVTRPGARVSARTGYAVGPEQTPDNKRRAINTVLGAPFVQQALKIDYTTYVMKAPEPGQHRVVLSLNADLPVRATPSDAADVVFVVRDVRDGRVVASGTDTMNLPAAAKPGVALGSGSWRVQFNVPAGSYVMRTVVREPGGLTGSADRRIDVRALDGPDVTASDLVIGSAMAGLPVKSRAFSEDGLSGVIEMYGRSPVQLEGLAVKVELRGSDNAPVKSVAATIADAEQEGSGLSRRASFQVPLAGVPPGEYIAHALVTARGEVVAERTRQVEVLGGHAPAVEARPVKSVSPLDVTRGDLGQKYIAMIQQRARGTATHEAAAHASRGRWEEVEAAVAKLSSDDSMQTHALRGFALFVRENYKGAATELGRALDLDQNALTAFFLGWAQEGAGDSRAALSAWRTSAHIDPSLVSAHLALADGYLKLSQPALAAQALRAGLTAIPSSIELQSRLQQLERIRQQP
jgi:VWFA-related protein